MAYSRVPAYHSFSASNFVKMESLRFVRKMHQNASNLKNSRGDTSGPPTTGGSDLRPPGKERDESGWDMKEGKGEGRKGKGRKVERRKGRLWPLDKILDTPLLIAVIIIIISSSSSSSSRSVSSNFVNSLTRLIARVACCNQSSELCTSAISVNPTMPLDVTVTAAAARCCT